MGCLARIVFDHTAAEQIFGYPLAGITFSNISSDGQWLGSVVVHNYRPGCTAELGIATSKVGLSRPLIRAVFDYVFNQLALPRISIVVRATDASQLDIVKRIGFEQEAILSDWYGVGVSGIHFKLTPQLLLQSKFGRCLYGIK